MVISNTLKVLRDTILFKNLYTRKIQYWQQDNMGYCVALAALPRFLGSQPAQAGCIFPSRIFIT
jgi:hypothetical protein